MTQEVIDFYHFDSLWRIMKGEEKRGKLRADFYSSEVKEISVDLKSLRSQLRSSSERVCLRVFLWKTSSVLLLSRNSKYSSKISSLYNSLILPLSIQLMTLLVDEERE